MSRPPRNLAASIHRRLLNAARERGEETEFILQRYAAERFLYQLGNSPHREQFALKGAMLFALWGGSVYRPTRDLDFAGYGNDEIEAVLQRFRDICTLTVADDREAVVAEKFHAMVVLGERNSRYKDFYDLHVLARQFPFDGERLARSIAATFERRHTPIEAALPAALAPRFYADDARAEQWRAYLTHNHPPGATADFAAARSCSSSSSTITWR